MTANPRWLLDVNVLLALLWPRHALHVAAWRWFHETGRRSWATNPLIQVGVLRLLLLPSITLGEVGPTRALEALRDMIDDPNHELWPLDRNLPEVFQSSLGGLTGHKQWNDLLLLNQAAARGGVLVTFDSGITALAKGDLKGRVRVLGLH